MNKKIKNKKSKSVKGKPLLSGFNPDNSGPRVIVGIPTYSGQIPYQTVNSLLMLHKPKQTAIQFIPRQRVDKARNAICIEAMKTKSSHVLFIDDDNPVPPNTLLQLLKWDKDIISTPILQRGGEHKLCLFRKEEKIIKTKPLAMYYHLEKLNPDENGLQQIDACGMGCTLIKTKVIADLMKKYDGKPFEFGDISVEGQRRTMSEDVEFCERAVKEGYQVWIDTTIRPLHLGDPQIIVYYE